MSVSSILAFVLLGTRGFTGPRDRPEEKPTRPSYAELKARIAELEADVGAANELARRDQEIIDMWRERALRPAQPAGPDFRPAQIALAQAQMQQAQMQQYQGLQNQGLAQYNAHQALNAQNYAHGLGAPIGLLGAQTLIDAELWCNCVPSRSQVWAATDPE